MFGHYGVVVSKEEEGEEEGMRGRSAPHPFHRRHGVRGTKKGRKGAWVARRVRIRDGLLVHSERSAYLSAVDELHGGLAEEEVHVVLVLQGVDKVRGCRKETNLLSNAILKQFRETHR